MTWFRLLRAELGAQGRGGKMAGVCEGGKEGQRVWWEERFPTTGTKPAEPDLDKVALPRLETWGKVHQSLALNLSEK